jgi:hypothetical protein
MPHALGEFIRQQMDERGMRNRDLVPFGFSRAQASRLINDRRDVLPQLPHRETLEGLAKAFGTNVEFMLGKAVEALGIGYTSADFVNEVKTASIDQLLDEIRERLAAATATESGGGTVVELATAARGGVSKGSQVRGDQDDDATRPDPDGPEAGA